MSYENYNTPPYPEHESYEKEQACHICGWSVGKSFMLDNDDNIYCQKCFNEIEAVQDKTRMMIIDEDNEALNQELNNKE